MPSYPCEFLNFWRKWDDTRQMLVARESLFVPTRLGPKYRHVEWLQYKVKIHYYIKLWKSTLLYSITFLLSITYIQFQFHLVNCDVIIPVTLLHLPSSEKFLPMRWKL
jgi:hypothetical protein